MRGPLLTSALLLAMLATTRAALAQPTFADAAAEAAIGEALRNEAEQLAHESRLSDALDRFEASVRHDPSPAALLGLGDCYARVHRTASAWGAFHRAEERARALGDTPHAEQAMQRAQALAPTLSKVRIVVPASGPRSEITLDGKPFDASVWGTAIPVDPGRHTVRASAQGKTGFATVVDVPLGEGTQSVVVPELAPLPPASPPPPLHVASPEPSRTNVLLPVLVVTGCAGVAASAILLGVGVESHFTTGLEIGAGVSGFVGVVTLVTVFWTDTVRVRSTVRVPAPLQVSPMVARSGGGLTLNGAF